jgi:heme A synthase
LLVLFVAIAITNIQDQRMHEPALVALAAGGFALYGLIGWIGWWTVRRRLEARLGTVTLIVLYAIAMGALFLAATVIYLLIEHVYRVGHF